jgi:hypothetical protein
MRGAVAGRGEIGKRFAWRVVAVVILIAILIHHVTGEARARE